MQLAIATINFENFLSENARESFLAAATRWGAFYTELTEHNSVRGMAAQYQKFFLFDLIDADRIFYIDADAIIRDDTPSPFRVCPREKLGAVKNADARLPAYRALIQLEQKELKEINVRLGRRLEKNVPYFNSGMMILTKSAHKRMLERAFEVHRLVGPHLHFKEQSLLNYAAREMDIPLLLMEETWNYLSPEQVGQWHMMKHYVYHFAGSIDRRVILPYLSWNSYTRERAKEKPPFLHFPASDLSVEDERLRAGNTIRFSDESRQSLKSNLICHGPYCSLERGLYRFEIDMDIVPEVHVECSNIKVLLQSDFGKNKIARWNVCDMKRSDSKYIRSFEIKKDLTYFEVVLRSEGPAEIVLREIGLRREKETRNCWLRSNH